MYSRMLFLAGFKTRDERDFRNITGISAAGMALAGQSTTLPFRDQEDVNHFLTPAQAVTVGMAVYAVCIRNISSRLGS